MCAGTTHWFVWVGYAADSLGPKDHVRCCCGQQTYYGVRLLIEARQKIAVLEAELTKLQGARVSVIAHGAQDEP